MSHCRKCHLNYIKQWYKENHERCRKIAKKSYDKNLEKNLIRCKKWRRENPNKVKDYYINNKEIFYRNRDLRFEREKKATPHWVDKKEIKKIYIEARKLTKETGTSYQVDHIIPLVHKEVCGLHIPQNLRIVTAEENMKKAGKR